MPRIPTLSAAAFVALIPAAALSDSLTLFASGEDLATAGFQDPQRTKDGWALRFDHIHASFAEITVWRTDPPFMADSAAIEGAGLMFDGIFTVDLVDADAEDRVALASLAAEPGHYNALSFALVPAAEGEFAGYSLVLQGVAERDGTEVAFTLATADTVFHACGEYIGDERKGFVTADGGADLEITLHLDHLFGRADKPEDDGMNLDAPGFAPFAEGGMQAFSLAGLHLGHVGEGHCHVRPQ